MAEADGDGFGAGAGSEFAHDGGDVEFDGVLGDVEAGGDFFVAESVGEEAEDFGFAWGEGFEGEAGFVGCGRDEDGLGVVGVKNDEPGGGGLDSGLEFFGGGIGGEDGFDSGAKGGGGPRGLRVVEQKDEGDGGELQEIGRGFVVLTVQGDDGDIRGAFLDEGGECREVGGGPDDLEAVVGEQGGESGARHGGGCGKGDPNHAASRLERRRKSRTTLLGMARARPAAIMVLIPMTWPRASASGPPEFPGARRTAA